jgi:hypothetical protein
MPLHTIQARFHIALLMVAALGFVTTPSTTRAMEITVPVGLQEIGKRLDLKSTLSGIPEGAESQLRSTCLKSRIQSIDTENSADAIDVWVDFSPTIRQGGLIEFQSSAPVNHALVRLELISECPLLTFTSRWTLIMNQTQLPDSSKAVYKEGAEGNKFDLANSSLLAQSRKQPNFNNSRFVPRYEQNEQALEEVAIAPEANTVSEVPQNKQPEVDGKSKESANEPNEPNEPIKIASLDPSLLGNGLIESRSSNQITTGGLGINEQDSGVNAWSSNIGLMVAFGFSLLAASILLARKFARSPVRTTATEPQWHAFKGTPETAMDTSVPPIEEVATPVEFGHDRFLESLMGSEGDSYEDEIGIKLLSEHSEALEASDRSTLKTSFEMINRADSRKWNLPDAYLGLVEQRNRTLEQHASTEALILRSQIGIVELTFQDAKQGKTTQSHIAHELLAMVLGEHIYEAESFPSLGVPDVVKSHVRAKMCEISGSESRQLLRENLLLLNTLVLSPALCFHSDAWREFLSEEGMPS